MSRQELRARSRHSIAGARSWRYRPRRGGATLEDMARQADPRGLERLTDLPIALLVRAARTAIARAGPRPAYGFASLAATLWRWLAPRRRRIALRNLEIAFGERFSPSQRSSIARESCRHALATGADVFLRDRAVTAASWPRSITCSAEVERLLERPHPRGLVLLGGHLGDWEMAHYFLALRGLPVAAVARSIHNPHLDRLITALRTRQGSSVFPKTGALSIIKKTILSGGAVGLMADQSGPAGERCLSFLGARAATYFRYALLLARLRPEVHFVVCLRDGFRFRFHLTARDLSEALRGPRSEEARAERLVVDYLRALEEAVGAHPEQYLWVHRRWKRRPPGAPDLYRRLGEPLDPALLSGERLPEEERLRVAG
jgi:KDO2-lipid IV(A) lauroyltransferase